MVGRYVRLSEATLKTMLSDRALLDEFLLPDDPDASPQQELDIDKTWHLIHFLLTGSAWEGESPLCNAVLGGAEIGEDDFVYGPPRYLTANEVSEVHEALTDISGDELWSRFDANAIQANELYADTEPSDEYRDYVLTAYAHLRSFFAAAASEQQAMLLYLG